jgi:hypothetical protein
MCWFEHGISRGAGAPAAVEGLGLVGGSHCVHYAQDPSRRDCFRRLVGDGTIPPGLALDDHAAALIQDGELVEAVRSRGGAAAHRVEPGDGELADEVPLEVRLLPVSESVPETGLDEMRELRRVRSRSGGGPHRLGRMG